MRMLKLDWRLEAQSAGSQRTDKYALETFLLLLEIIPKISRASTDATGASLTKSEVEMADI